MKFQNSYFKKTQHDSREHGEIIQYSSRQNWQRVWNKQNKAEILQLKSTRNENKNRIEGINSRIDQIEESVISNIGYLKIQSEEEK